MREALALQRAMRAALVADDAVKSLIGDPPRLYDAAPADARFPLVVFAETRERAVAPLLCEHDVRLSVSSSYRGRREARDILIALHDALHERDLAVEGARLVYLRAAFSDCFWRPDAARAGGVIRFRALTERA